MPVKLKSKSFPGVDQLPDVAREAVEFLFPPDELGGVMPPTPMVAGVSPANLPFLRERGKNMIDRVKRLGLKYGSNMVPVPPDLIDILEFAQQKYPRLFGHLTDITHIGEMFPKDQIERYRGAFQKSAGPMTKRGRMSINPQKFNATTIGHELLHSADNLVDPKEYLDKYQFFNTLPGGYAANSMEVRARNMGDTFAEKYAKAKLKKAK